jgi:tellurite resistance protein TerA
MELKSKITLKAKGDAAALQLKGKGAATSVHAKLTWTKAVDLDLHCFYRTRDGQFGHVYFAEKGKIDEPPYIMLDEDAGVGNTAGDNEENIRIDRLDHLESVLIATNIFRFFGFLSAGDNFAKYDGRVVVTTNAGDLVEVPLTSEEMGKWCLIARIENGPIGPRIVNVNEVRKNEPGEADLS